MTEPRYQPGDEVHRWRVLALLPGRRRTGPGRQGERKDGSRGRSGRSSHRVYLCECLDCGASRSHVTETNLVQGVSRRCRPCAVRRRRRRRRAARTEDAQ